MRAFNTSDAPSYLDFISAAVESNGLVYTAAIPRRPVSLEIPSGFADQTRLAFENLRATLKAAGTSVESLVKVNVYLADMSDWSEFNELYRDFVSLDPPPMRVAAQVALNNGYLIELDVIAEAASAKS